MRWSDRLYDSFSWDLLSHLLREGGWSLLVLLHSLQNRPILAYKSHVPSPA